MLIEREEPLSVLLQAAQQSVAGRGKLVVVQGEAGIGKTTLLRAFVEEISPNIRVFWGGCEALFTPRPLGPLHDIAASLDAKVAGLLDQGESTAKIFPALLHALEQARQGSILIFEDVHWADHATLDLIKYLGRRMMLLRALLVVSLRKDEVEPNHPLAQVLGDLPQGNTLRIDLKPLSESGIAILARTSRSAADELFRVTKGNPFFVTELLQFGSATQGALPASIRDAVWARLARLKAEEQELVDVMSLVPGGVEESLLSTLLGRDPASLIPFGLIERNRQGYYMFRHELARLATLERLLPDKQQMLHKKILSAMKTLPDMPLSRLVHHAAGAGDAAQVLELAPKAAAEAAKLGAHQQAAAHLATGLRFAEHAAPELAAELNESWSYEAGLALKIDETIIAARHNAIAFWRKAGRIDKVGHNLRWLARLHWYRGEAKEANTYLDQAIAALESIGPGPELAMAYSARSQMHMLNDRTDEAIDWGKRAIALAETYGETETLVHALNNVGSALLFSGRDGGSAYMEKSLALALQHDLHEQAARAYTNFAEYAVLFRDFPLAERLLSEGISFDTQHDLDAWTHYLVGRQAQLRMDQARFREAEAIAKGVLALDRLTLLMRLPALTVLARLSVRLGNPEARSLLNQALKDALATGEQQYISPVYLGLAEYAWLSGNHADCRDQLQEIAKLNIRGFDPWELGEFAVWWKRAMISDAFPVTDAPIAAPRRAELAGSYDSAAEAWLKLGLPYEAGLTLLQKPSATTLIRATELFQSMEAKPAEILARRLAKEFGAEQLLPRRRRGPYSASRSHPMGLTGREVEVLRCIADGMSNQEIARKLLRSQRTVEHHVSAVLSKLNASSRLDVILRLRSEPWLMNRIN